MLLALENISKSYGDTLVLDRITCTLAPGRKVGLVGANGVGKSTLLKIVGGEVEPDSGRVQVAPGHEIGYLPQALDASGQLTVDGLLDQAMGSLVDIERRLHELEAEMAAGSAGTDALLDYGRLQEKFERRGGYDRDYRIAHVLAGLGVPYLSREAHVARLSGGERSRVNLAALLLAAPDLLLLDEPTNHLDFRAIDWLEGYLEDFPGGVLVVSHDRQFLSRTVETIMEIEEHSRALKVYSGNYEFYASQKVLERERWAEEYERQQEEIHELRKAIASNARQVAHNREPSDKDKFLKAFKAGRVEGVISRNVRSAEERLRRIELDPIPRPPRTLTFDADFDPDALVSRSPLMVSGLSKTYGERRVLREVSFAIDRGTRAAIVGPNGAGKSTLLRIIAGLADADEGEVDLAGSVILGYLDQQQETLPHGVTVFAAYRGDRPGAWEETKAELLGYGLFTWPDLAKQVDTLSVGQKRKLQIACLIAERSNLLLLDEPTNHISLDVLEQFEAALAEFPGPVIAVSHDRRFLERFANEIWVLQEGTLRRYLGNWQEYWEANREDALNL